jgi:hypothetical protein
LAYHCLKHLVNRFWLNNLASMHNHRSLFNMDISGGMPAVIIKMLVASDPGKIQLLPALPPAWPAGTIDGVLCRGGIEIRSLKWDKDRILVTLTSAKAQQIVLEAPAGIAQLTVTRGDAKTDMGERADQRLLTLPACQPVTLEIRRN